MHNLIEDSTAVFERIMHMSEGGQRIWDARELQDALGYTRWQGFSKRIEHACSVCAVHGFNISDHFAKIHTIDSSRSCGIPDYLLSPYACYLIAMAGDPRKRAVTAGQAYFADIIRREGVSGQSYFESEVSPGKLS